MQETDPQVLRVRIGLKEAAIASYQLIRIQAYAGAAILGGIGAHDAIFGNFGERQQSVASNLEFGALSVIGCSAVGFLAGMRKQQLENTIAEFKSQMEDSQV